MQQEKNLEPLSEKPIKKEKFLDNLSSFVHMNTSQESFPPGVKFYR